MRFGGRFETGSAAARLRSAEYKIFQFASNKRRRRLCLLSTVLIIVSLKH